MICKTFALPRAAKLLQTTLIFNLTENFVKLTEKIPVCNEISANLVIFFSELELISSLVNSIAILLRDRRLGGYIFANPWESYFIPRGFAPWDEIRLPRVAKTIASRSAITQYYNHNQPLYVIYLIGPLYRQ